MSTQDQTQCNNEIINIFLSMSYSGASLKKLAKYAKENANAFTGRVLIDLWSEIEGSLIHAVLPEIFSSISNIDHEHLVIARKCPSFILSSLVSNPACQDPEFLKEVFNHNSELRSVILKKGVIKFSLDELISSRFFFDYQTVLLMLKNTNPLSIDEVGKLLNFEEYRFHGEDRINNLSTLFEFHPNTYYFIDKIICQIPDAEESGWLFSYASNLSSALMFIDQQDKFKISEEAINYAIGLISENSSDADLLRRLVAYKTEILNSDLTHEKPVLRRVFI